MLPVDPRGILRLLFPIQTFMLDPSLLKQLFDLTNLLGRQGKPFPALMLLDVLVVQVPFKLMSAGGCCNYLEQIWVANLHFIQARQGVCSNANFEEFISATN